MTSVTRILCGTLIVIVCATWSAAADREFKDSPAPTGAAPQPPYLMQQTKMPPGMFTDSEQMKAITERMMLLEKKIDLMNKRIDEIERGGK